MATLDSLKHALREKAGEVTSSRQPLSDRQYSDGLEILGQDSAYQGFVTPQLSYLLVSLFNSHIAISVLEIGPGPKSIFGTLAYDLRRKVRRYVAFEPNRIFASRLGEWLGATPDAESPLPCLENPPDIRRNQFVPTSHTGSGTNTETSESHEQFDFILLCHSMYGMKSKRKSIEQALDMLVKRPEGGIVAVFHRDGSLDLDGLVCYRMNSFPNGVLYVANDDKVLDNFAPLIAGFVMGDTAAEKAVRIGWRDICRKLGHYEGDHPDHLLFRSSSIMAAFTRHATTLPELMDQVPFMMDNKAVKNREARLHRPSAILRPTEVRHIQACIQWALKYGVSLTVIGGGHSSHCLWPNVVSVDMGAFSQVHVVLPVDDTIDGPESGPFVVAEAGAKTGDVIRKAMAAGMSVPLGSRPSVGAGMWLQGGIGHLARLYGLTCDNIAGAVMVSVESGEIFCLGHVPSQHRFASAVVPKTENDILWAIQGAGNNFGIVISIVFNACPAPAYLARNQVNPLSDILEARLKLKDYEEVSKKLNRNCSADAYLFWESNQLHLGVTMFESSPIRLSSATPTLALPPMGTILGPEDEIKSVDGIGIFEAEIYMTKMHGGHGGSRTSAFKRCLFLETVGEVNVADILVKAIRTRPTQLCYFHLLQGGGAIGDVAADATAFGCRKWTFACVIAGVWPRDKDGAMVAQAAKQWVYDVANDLLPLSSGAYGADLGPDPRDVILAAKAFGPNRPRLARIKNILDPHNVLAYACPLPKAQMKLSLVILVTGKSCVGKDYCANIWASTFRTTTQRRLQARAVSISDVTKQEYAAASGADLQLLLRDRAYKEKHRPALTKSFQDQVQHRPSLPEEHFLDLVHSNLDVDVLLITGMRDEAPVASFSHLVPEKRLLEIRVECSQKTRRIRRACHGDDNDGDDIESHVNSPNPTTSDGYPRAVFHNKVNGQEAAIEFAHSYLLPYVHENLQRLATMVRRVPNFSRPGIEFRHVLGIPERPGGLDLCSSLFQAHFAGDWGNIHKLVCCETGGILFATHLSSMVKIPLALIREAGKLPPPTFSVLKPSSHISSSVINDSQVKRIEMERDLIPESASVLVIDDVLATGKTLCAVLQLLNVANISIEEVKVMVVAEFPVHQGRKLLRRFGFGAVNIQSLLVFGGA
ncbi:uncharacterized protein LDX57_012106 [Aspergillus melleus]|uniref:uncharacterized protein n=1 Tax=Aspergillus melleus TaxID=138277 RepID=UPI001E8D7C6C|nr:uncharacterized protein LDX57_012106 [Aspergillus melleus]KAH8434459.1 hypothetical protein LDX57_012106 [Aspergillus melleus]